jgi:hypothetical protein
MKRKGEGSNKKDLYILREELHLKVTIIKLYKYYLDLGFAFS